MKNLKNLTNLTTTAIKKTPLSSMERQNLQNTTTQEYGIYLSSQTSSYDPFYPQCFPETSQICFDLSKKKEIVVKMTNRLKVKRLYLLYYLFLTQVLINAT